MAKKQQELTPFRECLEKMVDAYHGLNDAKDEKDKVCTTAYEEFMKTVKVGDEDPPSIKSMEKVAKALADEKVSKLQKELQETTDTLIRAKRDDAQGELFKEDV